MFKKKHYLALGAVVLVALLIFSLPQRATSRLKLAVGSCFCRCSAWLNTAQQLPVDCRRRRPAPARIAPGKSESSGAKTSSSSVQAMQAAAIAQRKRPAARAARLAAADAVETQARQRRHARPGQLVAHRAD